jgi:ABC-type transport system involved in multi-copper enzyme maturation permease subunit
MRNPLTSPIAAVIQAELLFNLQRVAPRLLVVLFSLNAMLWWGSASVHFGWASNGDFYLIRIFYGFSFLTAPFFVALLMGDAVARDLRLEVHPLLFSSSVRRAEYVLGKFFGNFLVLIGCCAAFALTAFLLQWAHWPGVVLLPWRGAAYVKHFVALIVVTNLLTAAFCFTVGVVTRSAKLVYGLVVVFYVLYFAVFATLHRLAPRLAAIFDPFLLELGNRIGRGRTPDAINRMTVVYDAGLLGNRFVMLGTAAVCLALLCWRFSFAERRAGKSPSTSLSLNEPAELIGQSYDVDSVVSSPAEPLPCGTWPPVPRVFTLTQGFRAHLAQLVAAVAAEFRCLRAERSLIVIAPLAVLACALELSPAGAPPVASVYATNSAQTLLVILFGVTLFYAGETMHRDRELRVEPLLWSAPAPDWVVLLSKFAATLLVALALMVATAATAVGVHLVRDPGTVEVRPYFLVYSIILWPTVVFMAGATITLHAILREKYLAHTVGLGLGGGLVYLIMQGSVNSLYNPALSRLWTYADLTGRAPFHNGIVLHRVYLLTIATALLAAAHYLFQRPANRRSRPAAIAAVLAVLAAALGMKIGR